MGELRHAAERVPVSRVQLAEWGGQRTGSTLRLWGPCPACRHRTTGQVSLTHDGLETLDDEPTARLTVSLACDCRRRHPDRPDGPPEGCGRTWTAVADIGADAGVTLAPSGDGERDEAAEALRRAQTGRADRLRAAAEKWIAGIAALLGLLTVAGLGLGAEQVRKLATPGRVAMAVTVAVAMVCAAFAIVRAYQAAYGWPRSTPVTTDDLLLAWHAAQHDLPATVAGRLRSAARWAGAALAALVVAAALSWLLPVAKPPSPLVKVTVTDDSTVCGTLLDSAGDAQVRLRRADDGAVATIPAGQVRRVAPIAAC